MNIKQAAQVIRDTIGMEDILALYGYKTRKGSMCCPFHGEKNPSLKIYSRTGGWHCFGCGRGGSVIDFVMEQEGCKFNDAVKGIDKALRLGLTDEREHPMKARQEERIQHYLDSFVDAVNAYCDALLKKVENEQQTKLVMVKQLEAKRDNDVRNLDADEWTLLLNWANEDDYDEYRKKKIEEFKEEVAAWRRKARRAM